MKMEKFEDILNQMSKPEPGELKHADVLSKAIVKAKDRSAVGFWWLSIPVYLIAAFIMKSIYTPNFSIASAFHELFTMNGYMAVLLFLVLPVLLIIINLINIKQLYFLYGNNQRQSFAKLVFTEVLIIILSLIALVIYFYETYFN